MKKEEKRYTADFETEYLTAKQIEEGAQTYVWAWALCDCDTYEIQTGTSAATFIQKMETLGSCEIYFHNLRYDIQFLLSYLMHNGWKQTTSNKHMQPKTFTSLVSAQGIAYSMEIKTKTGKVLILDSLKKLPMKVSKIAEDLKLDVVKGEIDYHQHREEGGTLSAEDLDYIKRDVLIPAIALNKIFFENGFTRRTIGADCLEYYKQIQPKFARLFPKLPEKERTFIRDALNGGTVYANPKKAGKLLKKNGKDYDDNSMYSWAAHGMSGFKLPIGQGIYYEGGYEYDARHPFYIQHIRVALELKKGHVPFIHAKHNGLYRDTQFVEDTHGEKIELVLCRYDIELMYDNYDVKYIELINGYKYEAGRGYFDKYIGHFYEMKRKAKEEGNRIAYLTSKLFLNNLLGKFGQTETGSNQIYSINDSGIITSEPVWSKKDTVYLPVSIAVCAIARQMLFRMINANLDHFCYCDTDCIKIDGELNIPEGVKIDNFELGAWKVEAEWDAAVFIKPKTYAEHTENGWKITGAGMTEEVKANIVQAMEKDPKSFKKNAKFLGKLRQTKVPGGVVLTETTFQIT